MPSDNRPPKSPSSPGGAPEGPKPAEKLSPQEKKALAKRQRLSQALRANLRRRKESAREKA
jgi:hypothetical protein